MVFGGPDEVTIFGKVVTVVRQLELAAATAAPAYFNRRDRRRSASTFPPVWQVGQ